MVIRLRLNTLSARVLWRTAGMKGKANRAEACQSEGGFIAPKHHDGGLGYGAITL